MGLWYRVYTGRSLSLTAFLEPLNEELKSDNLSWTLQWKQVNTEFDSFRVELLDKILVSPSQIIAIDDIFFSAGRIENVTVHWTAVFRHPECVTKSLVQEQHYWWPYIILDNGLSNKGQSISRPTQLNGFDSRRVGTYWPSNAGRHSAPNDQATGDHKVAIAECRKLITFYRPS